MGSVFTVAIRRFAPQRFHVGVIDPFRQATVRCDLRAFHPAQRVDLPQTLAHQVLTEAAHRTQRRVHGGLGAKSGAVGDVARAHLGINALDRNAWATTLEPPPPPNQTRFGVGHRLRTDAPRAILFEIRIQ